MASRIVRSPVNASPVSFLLTLTVSHRTSSMAESIVSNVSVRGVGHGAHKGRRPATPHGHAGDAVSGCVYRRFDDVGPGCFTVGNAFTTRQRPWPPMDHVGSERRQHGEHDLENQPTERWSAAAADGAHHR